MNLLGPTETTIQLSAPDPDGRRVLVVLVKRTYRIGARGECELATAQVPLCEEPRYASDGVTLEEDLDLWPIKLRSDVVVRGHVYNHPRQPTFTAGISVGSAKKLIAVSGDRRCAVRHDGKIVFSAPTVIEKVPLSYAFAYGGKDAIAEAEYGNPAEELGPYLPPGADPAMIASASPFFYPRNPAGRGYLVEATTAAVDALVLPNLEHPGDLLTPDRLAAGGTSRWIYQPVPASLGWLDYGAFPRLAWLGVVPDCDEGADPGKLGEVRFGYCSPELFRQTDAPARPSFEGVQGASLGLRVPHLRGGEAVELLNLTRDRESFRFRLPTSKLALSVDGREGKLLRTDPPVIHSIVVEPDEMRLSIVWRGSAPARRAYAPDELKAMPYAVEE